MAFKKYWDGDGPRLPPDIEEQEDEVAHSEWHLDKRVPISMIGAFVLQTITLVYVGTTWKSDVDHRLSSLEQSADRNFPQEGRLTILEQKFTFIQDSLHRIEEKLDGRNNRETAP